MWETIHMMPEQSVQAAIDLNAEAMMPIHWGAFTLALHSWTDPVERVTAKAGELGVQVATDLMKPEFSIMLLMLLPCPDTFSAACSI